MEVGFRERDAPSTPIPRYGPGGAPLRIDICTPSTVPRPASARATSRRPRPNHKRRDRRALYASWRPEHTSGIANYVIAALTIVLLSSKCEDGPVEANCDRVPGRGFLDEHPGPPASGIRRYGVPNGLMPGIAAGTDSPNRIFPVEDDSVRPVDLPRSGLGVVKHALATQPGTTL